MICTGVLMDHVGIFLVMCRIIILARYIDIISPLKIMVRITCVPSHIPARNVELSRCSGFILDSSSFRSGRIKLTADKVSMEGGVIINSYNGINSIILPTHETKAHLRQYQDIRRASSV
jgi:hypothetical protein